MAAGPSSMLLNIKPFDGTGFSNWEFRVKLALEQANVLEVIENDPPIDATQLLEYNKKDVKARNIIVQCLSDIMLEMIKTKKTAREIMDSLSLTYQRKGVSTRVQLQRKLRDLKLTESTPMNTFLTEFEQIVYELNSAGGKMEQNEVISHLLSAMPESYQTVTTAIDVMFSQDESKITLDFVKNKLLLEEARQKKGQDGANGEAAFSSGYQKRQGKNSNNKWNNSESQGERKNKPNFPFKCHGCGVIGHKKYQCPKNKKNRETANVTENTNSNDDAITFLTTDYESHTSLCESADFKSIKFIVDSGATNHLVNKNTGAFLTNVQSVTHTINVAKQGEMIEATKQGNLLVSTSNKDIVMKDVWMCDNLLHNLLSVRKLEQKGFKIVFEDEEVSFIKNGMMILKGKLYGNLYVVILKVKQPENNVSNVATDDVLTHRRMGHSSKFPSPEICEICLKGKQTRLPFKTIPDDRKTKRILECISSDVCGPINPPTHDGKRYYVSFIDHFSHFGMCYLISKKVKLLIK